MYQFFFKFVVTTLTILSANLVTTYLTDTLISHKWDTRQIRFTLIAMLIITIIFYPLFAKLEDWLNKFSKKLVRAGKNIAGRYLGLLLIFIIGLIILTYFYADMWYSVNIFKLMASGKFFKML
jgi:hypothetical protein